MTLCRVRYKRSQWGPESLVQAKKTMGSHYVPRRYLRNFEAPGGNRGEIWLHDKRDGNAKLVPIKTVAQAKQFYSPETEARLAIQVERPANVVIEKLTTGQIISPLERLHLAHYIGIMHSRVPAYRRRANEMAPGVLDRVVANLHNQLSSLAAECPSNEEVASKHLLELAVAHEKFKGEPPSEVFEMINNPKVSQRIEQAIFNMQWRVLISTGTQYYITTDNPAFFFEYYGLGNPESELTFPLSTTHALHGSWQGTHAGLMSLNVNQRTVREVNRRLASGTERLAFYHESAPWLLPLLTKPRPHLSRIEW